MPRLRFPGTDDDSQTPRDPIPFPRSKRADRKDKRERHPDVLYAFEEVSRRMEDLARALGCLGHFDDDDDDDRPRAA
jgi:hypothetical protein